MGRTALICDDDPVLRGVVAEMVEAHGWSSSQTATAKGAILLADMLQPDLIVMDVALSGMSGLEATPIIHSGSPTSRIVVVSSFDLPRDSCVRAGAIEFVRKRDLQKLDDLLERLRSRSRAEDGLARLYRALETDD